jgi:hypothetical protein
MTPWAEVIDLTLWMGWRVLRMLMTTLAAYALLTGLCDWLGFGRERDDAPRGPNP